MRHGIVICGLVLAAGLLLNGDLSAGSLEPPGPPAPTMKTIHEVEPRSPIQSLPVVIGAPGSYYLTGDLTGVSSQAGITISSSFVTLDLNGFSLIGVAGSLDGITTQNGTRQIVIRNGVIRDWGGRGLSAVGTTEVHAEHLRLDSNVGDGVRVGPRSLVRETTSVGNGGFGFYVDAGSTITGCTAANNGLSGVAALPNSVVSATTASGHLTESGIEMGSGSVATDCTAQQNFIGIHVGTGGRVVNSVAGANTFGIYGTDEVSVEESSVYDNTSDGIRVGFRGLVRGNHTSRNGGDGIEAAGQNRIEDNQVTVNATGIRVTGANNLIVKNSAAANTLEYSIAAGNKLGPISADPTTAGPWANFDL